MAPGALATGDFVIDEREMLAVVTSVEPKGDGRDSVTVSFVSDLHDTRIGITSGLDVEVGATTDATLRVEGLFLRVGDLAFSPDTGCVGRIARMGVAYTDVANAYLLGVARLATREYVDGAMAALENLNGVEF